MRFDWHVPTELHFGDGRFDEAGALAARLGRHALLVTGRSAMERLGYTQKLTGGLAAHGVAVTLFKDLDATPTTDDVDRGADLARRRGADHVIALGGGSPLDAAKAIAAVTAGERPCVDYLYGRAAVTRALPLLAIPTTAGTGSEVNRSAIVTDAARRFKDGIRSDRLFPRIAVVDPLLTHELPPAVTAQTGFDTLAHAVESYVSPRAHPPADALALRAVEAVRRYLPAVLADPHDAAGRRELALAATMMGFNLSCVGTCLPHRIDKALCALHPAIAHGQCIALLYPAWAAHAWRGSVERFARLAEMLDPGTRHLPRSEQAAAFPGVVRGFIREIGLGRSARDFGARAADAPLVLERITGDISVNPVPVTKEDLSAILATVLEAQESTP
jgi:alcohol dehydrogenase class IV